MPECREWLLPHRSETAPLRSVTDCLGTADESSVPFIASIIPIPLSLLQWAEEASFLHCVESLLIVATQHPFCCCPDVVCNTLTGQQVVVPHTSRSCWAGGTWEGTVWGGQGYCGRRLISWSQYLSAGHLWDVSCSPHWAPLPPSGLVSLAGLPILPLQEPDWLRPWPGRRSWPWCRARLLLSSAQEAPVAWGCSKPYFSDECTLQTQQSARPIDPPGLHLLMQ